MVLRCEVAEILLHLLKAREDTELQRNVFVQSVDLSVPCQIKSWNNELETMKEMNCCFSLCLGAGVLFL